MTTQLTKPVETTTKLNDVDLEAVGSLIGAVADNPEKGATVWKASVDWKGAFRSEASIRDFAPVPSDEPAGLGGTDTAPNPVEQLLAAFGNCLAVGYAANASAAGLEIEELRVDVEGDLDLATFLGLRAGNAGFTSIAVNVHLATDGDDAATAALHRKVVSTSPVGHTLGRAVPLSVELV